VIEVPRTLQEILDNAEALAQQFEDLPDDAEVLDAEPLRRIQQATQARAAVERELAAAVVDAREQGISWAVIGAYMGTSGEAARQRYGGVAKRKKVVSTGDARRAEANRSRKAFLEAIAAAAETEESRTPG
jgi:hypothetical protein